ncbi:MAG TPA: YfcC family protein, partial [Roseivirga sp.]
LALVSMPIMGALGNIVGVPSEEIVNAYLFGFGLMQFVAPSGMILPSLSMVNVPYNIWLKFISKLMLILALVGMVILVLSYLI